MIKSLLKKLFWGGLHRFLTDKQYATFRYWLELDRVPDIENPQRFTEKLQYIKLYERTDLRKLAADRFRVRSYVAEKVGDEHLIPLVGNYEEMTEEVWNSLPNQFALKANHGCGMVKLVNTKSDESFHQIQSETQKWKQTDYFSFGREWVYKDLPRTIIAEKLLQNKEGKTPYDFKFFCIHGNVELIQIDLNRFGRHQQQFYDKDFNELDLKIRFEKADINIQKPTNFSTLISIAESLSSDFNFIRVDLYSVLNHVYFGELTNYPGNGFSPFYPDQFDFDLGYKLHI